MDAAGPCFTFPCIIEKADRVNADSAKFSQGLHTNNFEFGAAPRYADQDFIINNGIQQPGETTATSSHSFAIQIMANGFNNSNVCTGRNIIGHPEVIGLYNRGGTSGVYQVWTNGQAPYCSSTKPTNILG